MNVQNVLFIPLFSTYIYKLHKHIKEGKEKLTKNKYS